ncbi:hypothetical protein [Burkholderia ambifaria]|uniref:hypothetical protein n=1 Tax=Burkholderia ambifaria TaxID=152480 RepID=UPI002FE1B65B
MATGLFGAVMGYVGYRRSNQIKALDLRLELRKGLASAHESLSTLRELLDAAAPSRMATLAARGLGRSGASVAWEQALNADRAEVDRLAASLRDEATDFRDYSAEKLESEIVSVHKSAAGLASLITKYRNELAADDDARRMIAQNMTAINAARTRPQGQ